MKIISLNRRALFDYHIIEKFEAGIVLTGAEAKSCRVHSTNLRDSYITEKNGDMVILNMHIHEYKFAIKDEQDPKAMRKLLLHKKQINKLLGKVREKGMTIVPLSMYFNTKGIVKVEIALVRAKKDVDRRETIKEREWQREKQRLMSQKNF